MAKYARLPTWRTSSPQASLRKLRKKLCTMSVTAVMDAYRSAYFQCKLEDDKIPLARAVQNLVQALEGDAGVEQGRERAMAVSDWRM